MTGVTQILPVVKNPEVPAMKMLIDGRWLSAAETTEVTNP